MGLPIIIETHNEDGVEWGISFDGYNPESKFYVRLASRSDAFKLLDLIASLV